MTRNPYREATQEEQPGAHRNRRERVVYRMPVSKAPDGMRAVCERAEWDAIELANPGANTLIRAGITNEGEANDSPGAPRRGHPAGRQAGHHVLPVGSRSGPGRDEGPGRRLTNPISFRT